MESWGSNLLTWWLRTYFAKFISKKFPKYFQNYFDSHTSRWRLSGRLVSIFSKYRALFLKFFNRNGCRLLAIVCPSFHKCAKERATPNDLRRSTKSQIRKILRTSVESCNFVLPTWNCISLRLTISNSDSKLQINYHKQKSFFILATWTTGRKAQDCYTTINGVRAVNVAEAALLPGEVLRSSKIAL